ncbi:MAG: PepSY-associated TM helix domain-containing protein [Sphingorhabdus sp.]
MSFWKLNKSGLLFVPSKWQRGRAIRWLKRVHAWTGFWGAVLFLMLGVSGILLNHRDIWKIETGEPVEVSAMDIAVPAGSIKDERALGAWAKAEFSLLSEPRPPRGEGGGKDKSKPKAFLGKKRPEAEKWELNFSHPNGRLTVEHVKGSGSVAVKQTSQNVLGFLKNLHKGGGVGVAWVLFMDSIAGALIAMAVTGFLLWSRLHGGRLAAGALLIGSTALGTWAIWPYLL